MPRVPTPPNAAPDHGLVLRPFRAVRYGPGAGADLGALTSPPYDVLDPATVDSLQAGNPHNVVRLILPTAGDYDHVAHTLSRWASSGVLVRDAQPALYVYEYTEHGHVVRGLVGELGLRSLAARVVLPHEDVMPGPVDDRAALMRRTAAHLEPILLVYDGGGRASDVVHRVTAAPPLVSAVAPDGSTHRLWAVPDVAAQTSIAEDLRARQALIADGHHRYAAYRRCQHEHDTAVAGSVAGQSRPDSAWDFGLAMLVDQRRYPLSLGAIHRVVSGVPLAAIVESWTGDLRHFGSDKGAALRSWEDSVGRLDLGRVDHEGTNAVFLLTDGRAWVRASVPRNGSAVDAAVLHERLLPAWRAAEAQIAYLHDAGAAVEQAVAQGGTAVLLRPPDIAQVTSAAARGVLLPRKSTSFGPKPRMGLLMRQLDA